MVNSTATSISLTWDQLQGADAVDGFEINYSFTIIECDVNGNTEVAVMVPDGTVREHIIINSSTTPIEEDSMYTISLTAMNTVNSSEASEVVVFSTPQAGRYRIQLYNT